MSPRARDLKDRAGSNLHVALAPRTLEWALAANGNKDTMLDALAPVKPRVAERLRRDLAEAGPEEAADAILAAVEDVKGRFAQELALLISEPTVEFAVPEYLIDAIAWVAEKEDGGDGAAS